MHAGRKPRGKADGVTVHEAVNSFLDAKAAMVESGELSSYTWSQYQFVGKLVVGKFGENRCVTDLRSDDFVALRSSFAKGVGLVTLANRIRLTRIIFKFAFDSDLIEKPLKFAPTFKSPSKKNLQIEKNGRPKKMFEANEVDAIIQEAKAPFKAVFLLTVNCGLGNTDCARLPRTAINLETGWVEFPRPKTANPRRCPLWPETIAALRDVLAMNRKAKRPADADLVFINQNGGRLKVGRLCPPAFVGGAAASGKG